MHNKKRGESIALVYQPCAKFGRGQVGANKSESACGQLSVHTGRLAPVRNLNRSLILASCSYAMDLFPDSASDSDLDGSGNPDYEGDFETGETVSDIDVASDSDCEQQPEAASSSQACAVRRKPTAKKTKRQKQMNKAERKRLMSQMRQVDISQLIVQAEQQLSKQLHFSVFEERGRFLCELFSSHKSELLQLCTALVDDFCCIYENCAVGKDKCSRFNMQWHNHCSTLLIEPTSTESASQENESTQVWSTLSSGVTREVRNPVIISLCSAVYDLLLVKIRTMLSGMFAEESSGAHQQSDQSHSSEFEEVYYRFCGAALAGMYKERYKKMKSPSCKQKDDVSKELTVLDWIRLRDKSKLPKSLQYKDEGGMYFPSKSFIPFIKDVDSCVCEHANEVSFTRYGSKVIEVTTQELKSNQLLKPKFKAILLTLVSGGLEGYECAIDNVYQELIRKLCNTRLNEFITTHQLSAARKEGSATLAGQNLRDSLLTHILI